MAAISTVFESLVTGIPCPRGWSQTQVKTFAKIVGGSTPDRGDDRCWQGGQIPWVTPTDITTQKVKYLSDTADKITPEGLGSGGIAMLPAGTVLYTSRATIGAKSIAAIPVTTNQGFANFIPQGVESEFLFYLLDLLTKTFKRLGSGTTFPEVSRRDIKRVACFIPPPAEQTRIAETLKAADDHIRALEEQIRKAERVKKALLQSFPPSPKHGTGTPLHRVADITSGFTKGRDLAGHETVEVAYLTVVNVLEGRVDISDLSTADVKLHEVEHYGLHLGDILMTEGGDRDKVGRGSIWLGQVPRVVCQNHIFRVRLNTDEVLPWFMHYLLQTFSAKRYFATRAKQSSNLCSINSREMRLFELPALTTEAQAPWVERLRAADAAIAAIENQLTAARRVKQSLLQNLLTGKIRLKP